MTSLCNNEVATAIRSSSTRCSTVIDKAAATMPPEYQTTRSIHRPTTSNDAHQRYRSHAQAFEKRVI